jgi:hypothetical protein
MDKWNHQLEICMFKYKLITSTSRFFSVFVNAAIRHKVNDFARSSFGNFNI